MKKTDPISIISDGGVGVIQTDTLYGLVGSAYSKKTVNRMYKIKGRSESKPFIILISSIDDIKDFGVKLLDEQKDFLDNVWPGPTSIIVSCPSKKFLYLHRGTKSLAFRMPKNKKLRDFLEMTGPIVAPSANPQGLKPAHTIDEAKKYFGDKVDFYIDRGRKVGKPSRVISLLTGKPVIVRK